MDMEAWERHMEAGRYYPEEVFVVAAEGEVRRGPRVVPFEPDGYVYILAGGGYHKIGRAKDPKDRIRRLRIQLPFPVEIAHLIPCQDHALAEKTLHHKFAARRTNGEWFALSKGDLDDAKKIRAMRGANIVY